MNTETKLNTDQINEPTDVHTWFGLTYSNYLVLPRTLMQSMPVEWQHRMVTCLEEIEAAFVHIEQAPGYEVKACRWEYPEDMGDDQREALGITVSYDGDPDGDWQERWFHDSNGDEIPSGCASVPIPMRDPVPHYNRGRTFIEPKRAA